GGRSPQWTPPSLPPPPQPAPPQRQTQKGTAVRAPTPPKGVPAQPKEAAPQWQPPGMMQQRQAPPAPPKPAQPSATVQAKRVPTPARGHNDEDLALSTTAPMATPRFDGPSSMGDAMMSGEDPAFASTTPKPRITPPPREVSLPLGMSDLDELPPRRNLMPLYVGGVGLAVVLILGVGFLLRGKSGGDSGRPHDQYAQGRNLFLLDTEDAFHQAGELLQQAHGADANNPLILA